MNRLRHLSFPLAASIAAFAVAASAQTAQTAAPSQMGIGAVLWDMIPMFAIVFLIFFTMVIRPQQMKLSEHQKFIVALKRGENVVTSGGLIGRIASIEKEFILIEVASGVKVKVEPSHVVKYVEKALEDKSAA